MVRTDAQTTLDKAKATLTDAKAVPIDVSAETVAVNDATAKRDAADRAVVEATRVVEDTTGDQQTEAKRKLVLAKRQQEDATSALTKAEAALTKKRAEKVDVSTQESAVTVATTSLEAATTAELTATRERDDAVSAQAALATKNAASLTDLTAKLDAAKATRTAIGQTGAKMLYPQPRDAAKNVYDGSQNATADDTIGSRVSRLRLVGFPDFSASSFSQGDLSALVPIEALGVGLNISSTNVRRVSVKIPAAESYGLSTKTLLDKIMIWNGKSWGLTKDFQSLLPAASAQTGDLTGTRKIYLRVLAEIYYARAMDIGVYAGKSFGMRTQVANPTDKIGAQKKGSEDSKLPAMAPTDISTTAAGSPGVTSLVDGLQSRLGVTQTVPGGSVQVVNASDSSVGVRRVYDRPVAIGFRALTISVSSAGGIYKIEGVDIGSTSVPAAPP